MKFDPSNAIQDNLAFGEFGGVNPSITDSSTYTFLTQDRMEDMRLSSLKSAASTVVFAL